MLLSLMMVIKNLALIQINPKSDEEGGGYKCIRSKLMDLKTVMIVIEYQSCPSYLWLSVGEKGRTPGCYLIE